MILPEEYRIHELADNYKELLSTQPFNDYQKTTAFLQTELPHIWIEAYKKHENRTLNVYRISRGSFEFLFDDYESLLMMGEVTDDTIESRTIAAFGISMPGNKKRDDSRLRGWVGKTNIVFGKKWDKGHFIANSIGGEIDGCEMNVFIQNRRLNRGWSDEGKKFREMEKYCFKNPGTFCFHRPIYIGPTLKPFFLEYGILMPDNKLWIAYFDNR